MPELACTPETHEGQHLPGSRVDRGFDLHSRETGRKSRVTGSSSRFLGAYREVLSTQRREVRIQGGLRAFPEHSDAPVSGTLGGIWPSAIQKFDSYLLLATER